MTSSHRAARLLFKKKPFVCELTGVINNQAGQSLKRQARGPAPGGFLKKAISHSTQAYLLYRKKSLQDDFLSFPEKIAKARKQFVERFSFVRE